MRILLSAITGLSLFATMTGGLPAAAQDHDSLGSFKDWKAYSYQQGGGKRCTMASQPQKDEGNYSRRGEIWAFVLHRPADGFKNEVGFQMGYPIKEESQVHVKIGSSRFSLYTHGEGAYAYRAEEPALIKAMKRGTSMTVEGTSARGTKTKDTYSLSGFTAAKKAIDAACKN